jgi:hypothetical protein
MGSNLAGSRANGGFSLSSIEQGQRERAWVHWFNVAFAFEAEGVFQGISAEKEPLPQARPGRL